ncbi:MAG: hypothetical protein V4733_10870 [Verrucomicrobiota bacterium]
MSPWQVLTAVFLLTHAAVVAADTPQNAALTFLERLRSKNGVNLAPDADTAVTPHITKSKRESAATDLRELAKEISGGKFEVAAAKTDGPLAGVVLSSMDDQVPSDIKVLGIALLHGDGRWLPTPVVASFENTSISFRTGFRTRRSEMENWLRTSTAGTRRKLEDSVVDRAAKAMDAAFPGRALETMDTLELAHAFLSACATRDKTRMLALLSGGDPRSPSFASGLRKVDRLFASHAKSSVATEFLFPPGILRVPLVEPKAYRDTTIGIACFNPANSDFHVVEIGVIKTSSGRWRVDLPGEIFKSPPGNSELPPEDDIASFRKHWLASHPSRPAASFGEARQRFFEQLRGDSFAALIDMIDFSDAGRFLQTLRQSAHLWNERHSTPAKTVVLPIAHFDHGEEAAVSFLVIASSNPARPRLHVARFHRATKQGGWLWTPYPAKRPSDPIRDWIDGQESTGAAGVAGALVNDVPRILSLRNSPPPAEDDTRKIIAAWWDACLRDDLPGVLAQCAAPGADADNLFPNAGEAVFAANPGAVLRVVSSHATGRVRTARIQISHPPTADMETILFIAATPHGPRILLGLTVDPTAPATRLTPALEPLARVDAESAKAVVDHLLSTQD